VNIFVPFTDMFSVHYDRFHAAGNEVSFVFCVLTVVRSKIESGYILPKLY